VRLTVADTGIGSPVDEQSRLFTRFFRSSNAEAYAAPGTGLGLAIVKKLVDAHDGAISIDSSPDVGTTVTVELPAVADS
jgi:signal transduction histidine kinase